LNFLSGTRLILSTPLSGFFCYVCITGFSGITFEMKEWRIFAFATFRLTFSFACRGTKELNFVSGTRLMLSTPLSGVFCYVCITGFSGITFEMKEWRIVTFTTFPRFETWNRTR
jgi:hypothetical protein